MIVDPSIEDAAIYASTGHPSKVDIISISTVLRFSDEPAVGRFLFYYARYLRSLKLEEDGASDKITFRMRTGNSMVIIHVDGLTVTIEKKRKDS